MAPEIEAYRDAVSGRALNLKCRGGQSAPVEIGGLGYWSFDYWNAGVMAASQLGLASRPPFRRPAWDGSSLIASFTYAQQLQREPGGGFVWNPSAPSDFLPRDRQGPINPSDFPSGVEDQETPGSVSMLPIRELFHTFGSGYTRTNPTLLLGAHLYIGGSDRNGAGIVGRNTFFDRTEWLLQAINAQGNVTGSLRFFVDGYFRSIAEIEFDGHDAYRIDVLVTSGVAVPLTPTFGMTNTVSSMDELRLSAPDDSPEDDGMEPATSPGFDFWARLNAGAGSILEDGIEVQTVDLDCRYDARHAIGDYIGLPDDDDYNYVITEIDYIGRRKWQTLTCKRLRRVR